MIIVEANRKNAENIKLDEIVSMSVKLSEPELYCITIDTFDGEEGYDAFHFGLYSEKTAIAEFIRLIRAFAENEPVFWVA